MEEMASVLCRPTEENKIKMMIGSDVKMNTQKIERPEVQCDADCVTSKGQVQKAEKVLTDR